MSSSRRELDDTAPATEVPSEPGRRSRPDTFVPQAERYQLGAEIGRGGMGRVVEALDTKLGRTVALKEVLPRAGEAVERRFLREVRVTARLEHPSIVPLYDSGVNAEGRPFYVMRRVTGRPLDELIKRARGLDERLMLLPAVLRAIDAIAHAHKRGVIHRDLKPANILVGELGESIVIDWGLAKVIGEADPEEPDSLSELKAGDSLQTQFGAVFGTPGFLPPEQARGEAVGFGGDVYALGATLYQLLAGTPPHHGSSVTDVMDKTVSTTVTPLRTLAPGAPVELAAIVDKALAYDFTHRYRDASELAEDVRRFETGQLVAAHHYTSRQKVGRFVRRYRSLLLLGAIALTALTVFGVLGILRVYAEKAAAQEARDAAQKNAAELQDQAHELTLANATALVTTNPTKALAYLKKIPAHSRFEPRARGLAQSAYARGVAWGMKGPPPKHHVAKLSPSESRVLWQNRGSELRVYDLDQRRLLLTRPLAGAATSAVWGDDDHIVLAGADPAVIDVTTGAARRFDLPPVFMWGVSDRGTVGVAALEDGTTHFVELATGKSTPIARAPVSGIVAISSAGTWAAVTDADTFVSFHDLTGRELGRLELAAAWAVPMPDDSMLLADFSRVYRCRRDTTPICTEIELARAARDVIISVTRQGSSALVRISSNMLAVVDGDRIVHYGGPQLVTVAGGSNVPLSSDRDAIYIPTSVGWLPLDVPQSLLQAHVVSGAKRAVVFGDKLMSVFEIESWLPRRFDTRSGETAEYITDDTIIVNRFTMMEGIDWLDVPSLAVVAHADPSAPLFDLHHAPTGAIIGSTALPGHGSNDSAAVVYLPFRGTKFEYVTDSMGPPLMAAFADGTALVVRSGREVVTYRPGGPGSAPMKLSGNVISMSIADATHFVALLDSNELVIGEPSTRTLERYPIEAVPPASLVASAGATICATFGRKVVVWRDRRFVPVGELPIEPEWIGVTERALVASFRNTSAITIDLDTGTLSPLFEQALAPVLSNRPHSVFATYTNLSQIQIVELQTQTRWDFSVPFRRTDLSTSSLSPDGSRLLLNSPNGSYEWQLHRVGDDYDQWLEGATNALIIDGKLTWDLDSKARLAP